MNKFCVIRNRFSVTQGEAEVVYCGKSVVQYGDTITLNGEFHSIGGWGSIYSDDHFINAAIKQFPEQCGVKTYAAWDCDLDMYLKVGDMVDEEISDHFLNVLPPACWRHDLIQLGEPHSHINGRATYPTLAKRQGHWHYAGNCHRGEHTEPAV